MSIDPTFCPSPAMAITIWLLWLCGVLAGGGLTVLECTGIQSGAEQQGPQAPDGRSDSDGTTKAAGRGRTHPTESKQEEALDELMDEQIDCAECHPMYSSSVRSRTSSLS